MQSIKTILEMVRVKFLKGEHEVSFSIQGMSDVEVEGIIKDLYDLNYTAVTHTNDDGSMVRNPLMLTVVSNLVKCAQILECPTYVIPLVELDREEIFEIRQYLLETGAATQATITNCPPQPLALELRLK